MKGLGVMLSKQTLLSQLSTFMTSLVFTVRKSVHLNVVQMCVQNNDSTEVESHYVRMGLLPAN